MKSKWPLLAGITVAAGLVLLAATQRWVRIFLSEGAAAFLRLDLTGQELAPACAPLACAMLAAALALTIARRRTCSVLGMIVILCGVGVLLIAADALLQPEDKASGTLAQVSGLAGTAQQAIVQDIAVTYWPFVTLLLGGGVAGLGFVVLCTCARWSVAGRKYEGANGAPTLREYRKSHAVGVLPDAAAGRETAKPDRIFEWDAITGGLDPSTGSTGGPGSPAGDASSG